MRRARRPGVQQRGRLVPVSPVTSDSPTLNYVLPELAVERCDVVTAEFECHFDGLLCEYLRLISCPACAWIVTEPLECRVPPAAKWVNAVERLQEGRLSALILADQAVTVSSKVTWPLSLMLV